MIRRKPTSNSTLGALGLLIGILLVHLWDVSAGWTAWPEYSVYYSGLANAFVHGQISLLAKPPEHLLAMPDPYDPVANSRWRLHDAILFGGKYYFYWGPAPALGIAAVCKIIGSASPQFGDEFLVMGFMSVTVMVLIMWLMQLRRGLFPRLPGWTMAVPAVSFGVGGPVLYFLARGAIYEAAISGGQMCLIAGFCAASIGLRRNPNWAAMLAAGICWCLAIGCRLSLAPALAATTVFSFWRLWRMEGTTARKVSAAVCLGAPQCLGVALLLVYNYLRFHSFTEFGLQYQLAGHNFHE